MRALIKGLEDAKEDLDLARSGSRSALERLWLSTEASTRVSPVITWIGEELPSLRRRLALAEVIASSLPGMPNLVTIDENSLPDDTPQQAQANGRRAAELLAYSYDEDKRDELTLLLLEGRDDPYFAQAFASGASPEDYAQFLADLTPYDDLRGDVTSSDYELLLDGMAQTLGLASRGTGELAMPPEWADEFTQMMAMPQLDEDLDPTEAAEQMERQQYLQPGLWLLLSRGQWSTDFLQSATTRISALDFEGYLWDMGRTWSAITPDGERFMDPMVALFGALAQNPEAAHWAFTTGGTTEVPFPKDGENATGEVNTFMYNVFSKHRFLDEENGPAVALLAMRSASMWLNDPSIAESAENLQTSMEQQQEVWDEKPWYAKWGHTILDVLGLFPVLGEPADAINAAWYGLEGDWVNAGLSAAGLIPSAGAAVTAGRSLSRAGRLTDTLRMVRLDGTEIEAGSDLARALGNGIKIDDGVYRFLSATDLNAALRARHPNMEFRSASLSFTTDAAGDVSNVRVYVEGEWVDVPLQGLGLRLAPLRAGDSPWDMLGLPRGNVIETALSRTDYRHFDHVGVQRNGFYPGIDFYDPDAALGVSLKTMDPPNASGIAGIRENIDDLERMVDEGVNPDGNPLDAAEVDLRVRIGWENHPDILELQRYAEQRGITLNVNTF